jgi:GNAT superfamily N-acetyltransferase
MPAAATSFKIQYANDTTPGIGEAIQRLLGQSNPEYVVPSPEGLHLDLTQFFGSGKPSRLVVARLDGYAEGLIVGLADMAVLKTLERKPLTIIQHLVVDENYRYQGVGRQLFEHLLQDIAHSGGGRVILACKGQGLDDGNDVINRLVATKWITITEGDNPLVGEVPRAGLF